MMKRMEEVKKRDGKNKDESGRSLDEYNETGVDLLPKADPESRSGKKGGSVGKKLNVKGLQTIVGKSEGLKSIAFYALEKGEGNVHSGAKPPWEEEEEAKEEYVVIGPLLPNEKRDPFSSQKVVTYFFPQNNKEVVQVVDEEEYDPKWMPDFGSAFGSGKKRKRKK